MNGAHPRLRAWDTALVASKARVFCRWARVSTRLTAHNGLRGPCRGHSGRQGQPENTLWAHLDPRFFSTALGERQHGAGSGGRSLAIRPRMRPNSSRGTATSAIWKKTSVNTAVQRF